jgi:hypothetical protein
MAEPTVDDLVRRLDRLQLKNRRLKWLTALLTASATAMAIYYNLPQRRIYLPSLIVILDGWDAGIVSAQGTWTSDANKALYPPVFPDKASKIVCYKDLGYCFESIATLKENLLHADQETLEIERWDQERVITRPKPEGVCGQFAMSISRAMKSVDGLIVRTAESGLCNSFPKEQRLRLGDGP